MQDRDTASQAAAPGVTGRAANNNTVLSIPHVMSLLNETTTRAA